MSGALLAPLQMSMAALAVLAGVTRALPLVHPAEEPGKNASFTCPHSKERSLDKCFGPPNGGCSNGSKCFMRETNRTKRFIASCCCDKRTTPVEEVERENWSCWVENKTSSAASHRPFCDILCCERPWLSRACYGNDPICCDERVSRCGISSSGGACCAPLPGMGVHDPHCSLTQGHTCGWVHTSWLTLPMHNHRCLVGSQAHCQEHCELLSRELLLTIAGAIMASCTCCNWGERRVTATCRALRHVLALFIAASLVLLSAFWAGHAFLLCLLWTIFWLVLALLPALCWHRARLCRRPRQRRQQQQARQWQGHSFQSHTVSLAILVSLEDYELWQPREGHDMENLRTQLTERGWTVPPIYWNLNREGFDSLIRYVGGIIEGSTDARVLIFISCYSHVVFSIPQMLPVEAGKLCWWRGVSIYQFMHQLSRFEATRPHFAILVNGSCLGSVGWWQELCWWLAFGTRARAVQFADRYAPERKDAAFSLLFACNPERQARSNPLAYPEHQSQNDQLTRQLGTFLADPSNTDLKQFFGSLQRRPWTMTKASAATFGLSPRSSRSSNAQILPISPGSSCAGEGATALAA